VDYLLDLIIYYKFIVLSVSFKDDGTQLSHTDMIGFNTTPFDTSQEDVLILLFLFLIKFYLKNVLFKKHEKNV